MGDDGATEADASKDVAWPADAGETDRLATGAWSGVTAMAPHASVHTESGEAATLVAVSIGVTVPSPSAT